MRISDWSSDVCSSDLADRIGDGIVARIAELGTDPEQAREHARLDDAPPVIVDAVGKPARAAGVGGDHSPQIERAAVGEDQPSPDHQRPRLAMRDARIIVADQPRALRDQTESGRAARGESVCQYGQTWVAAGAIQKKK